MAFPSVTSITSVHDSVSSLTDIANMPATVNAGDLLLGVCHCRSNNDHTAAAGWTEIHESASNSTIARLIVYAKKADGTEDGTTVTFTHVVTSHTCNWHVFRIPAGSWYDTGTLTDCVEATSTGSTVAAQPDPPNHTPTGGAQDILWIAAAMQGTSTATLTSGPSGYSGAVTQAGNSRQLAVAWKQANAASENPGAYTFSATGSWIGCTISVRPVQPTSVTLVAMSATASMPPVSTSGPENYNLTALGATASMPVATLQSDLAATLLKMSATASMPVVTLRDDLVTTLVKMAATGQMPVATVQVGGSYTLLKMAATAQMPAATLTLGYQLTLLKMAATASMPSITAQEATPYYLVKMAATAQMPVATFSAEYLLSLQKMAATASMPTAAASVVWLLVKMAATGNMPSVTPTQTLSPTLAKMAATAQMPQSAAAIDWILVKMAATASMPTLTAQEAFLYFAVKMSATAQMPSATVTLNAALLKMAATASMPVLTASMTAPLVKMSATGSMPIASAALTATLVKMAATASMPSITDVRMLLSLQKMAATGQMPSATGAALLQTLAKMAATGQMRVLTAQDRWFLVKMSASGLVYPVDMPQNYLVQTMMAVARMPTLMRGGVLPGDPRYKLPAGTAGWPEAPPAGSAAARQRLPVGAANE